MNYELAIKNIRSELKDYIVKGNLKSLVLGVSGGIDSALCAALAKPVCVELNIPLIGVSLPTPSNKQDEIDRALLTCELFCTEYRTYNNFPEFCNQISHYINDDIEETKQSKKEFKIRNGNIKARMRMMFLYNLASKYKGMVLSTDNWTEYLLGFWTLHGDVGDYGMIQELWKTEVYEMAEYLIDHDYDFNSDQYTALKDSIDAMATDGLGVTNRGDLGQIMPEFEGTSRDGYKEVDQKLKAFLLLKNKALMTPQIIRAIDKMIKDPVIERHLRSHYKRHNPTNIKRAVIEDDGDPYDMSVHSAGSDFYNSYFYKEPEVCVDCNQKGSEYCASSCEEDKK